MNVLVEWLGKVDELSIAYDAGRLQSQMLPGGVTLGENLPAIIYPVNDNINYIEEHLLDEKVIDEAMKRVVWSDWMWALTSYFKKIALMR